MARYRRGIEMPNDNGVVVQDRSEVNIAELQREAIKRYQTKMRVRKHRAKRTGGKTNQKTDTYKKLTKVVDTKSEADIIALAIAKDDTIR